MPHLWWLLNATVLLLTLPTTFSTRDFPPHTSPYSEAPEYRNGADCPILIKKRSLLGLGLRPGSDSCDPALIHVAMTLDSQYLRGTIAAVHSILKHTSCPESIFFHFITSRSDPASWALARQVRFTFPSLSFKIHPFHEEKVKTLISSSVRVALEVPLNYARNYLGDLLDACVPRAIYLDSDLVLVDDIFNLWSTTLTGGKSIGAPEYCHANFAKYFTSSFWSDPGLNRVFSNRRACYFNTGVMVVDLVNWRRRGYTKELEKWMEVQKKKRIYELGSLPPFLLVFAGEIEAINHRWNQHGLGGDNVKGSCRSLHPGPVSLLHWSGKGKPWSRLDEKNPCPLDHLWKPYDLFSGGGEGGQNLSFT